MEMFCGLTGCLFVGILGNKKNGIIQGGGQRK